DGRPLLLHAFPTRRSSDLGDAPQRMVMLEEHYEFYLQQAQHQMAHELVEQLFSLAQRQRAPALLMTAHAKLGQSWFWLGELAAAGTHLAQALALADAAQLPAVSVGRSVALRHVSIVLWLQGYPEQAMKRYQKMLTQAR